VWDRQGPFKDCWASGEEEVEEEEEILFWSLHLKIASFLGGVLALAQRIAPYGAIHVCLVFFLRGWEQSAWTTAAVVVVVVVVVVVQQCELLVSTERHGRVVNTSPSY
jgi:hypothetical protein